MGGERRLRVGKLVVVVVGEKSWSGRLPGKNQGNKVEETDELAIIIAFGLLTVWITYSYTRGCKFVLYSWKI